MKKFIIPALMAVFLLSSCDFFSKDKKEETVVRKAVDEPKEEKAEEEDPVEAVGKLATERVLEYEDIRSLSKKELRIVRNWIFATHGYKFKSKDLRDYFSQKDWYEPRYSNVSASLTAVEQQNVAFIQLYE
jgi:protein involved in sex pheromone biosynthesis